MEDHKKHPYPALTSLVGALVRDEDEDVSGLARLATELALLSHTVVMSAGSLAAPEERDALYHLRIGAINEGVNSIMMGLRDKLKKDNK